MIVVIGAFLQGQEESLRASPMSTQYHHQNFAVASSGTQGHSSRNIGKPGGGKVSRAGDGLIDNGSTAATLVNAEQKAGIASGRLWDLVQGVATNDDGENGKNANSFVLWGQQSNRWDRENRFGSQKPAKESFISDGMAKNKSRNKFTKKKGDRKETIRQKFQAFPIVEDDRVPSAASGAIVHASDALLCQETVVDYVINATDLKDECDGLKKAFTKNCGDEEQPAIQTARREQRNLESRGISQTLNPLDASNPVKKWQYRLHRISLYIRRWFEPKPVILMVEDEILREWDNSAFEVRQGWDMLTAKSNGNEDTLLQTIGVPTEVYQRRMVDEAKAFDQADKHLDRQAAAELDADTQTATSAAVKTPEAESEVKKPNTASSLTQAGSQTLSPEEAAAKFFSGEAPPSKSGHLTPKSQNETTPTKTNSIKEKQKLPNLSLPTKLQHVSDKMLDETLMLQQEDKIMANVKAARDNENNKTASSSTAEESAAASAKAVSDTVDLVSTVLNDPTLVEARTCCASILNVFHENCNVDEDEEISDSRLFVGVAIIALCGLVKSLIRHFHIRWLPEAAGCILVGGK